MRTIKHRKSPWHARAVRTTADWVERLSRARIVQVGGNARGKGRELSNFAPAQFRLNEVKYASFESFWQSLKFPLSDPMREKISMMHAADAKRAGSRVNGRVMFYGGRLLEYGSQELYAVAKEAERERFRQNPQQLDALLHTGNARLIHWVSVQDPASLPRSVFCRILMELRDEFRKKK